MEQIAITQEGYDRLKKELENLKTVERPNNIKAIEVARAHGDLSENAEFTAAKERQSFIEGRIGELGYKLASANIVDITNLPKDIVRFGHTVMLENSETEEILKYQLVGSEESDINKGRISVVSPLGKAILGKRPGDEVVVKAPGGKRYYEVNEII